MQYNTKNIMNSDNAMKYWYTSHDMIMIRRGTSFSYIKYFAWC